MTPVVKPIDPLESTAPLRPTGAPPTQDAWRLRRYPATRIAGILSVLTELGVPASAALAGTGLSAAEVADPATLTSADQLYCLFRQAHRMFPASDVAARIGLRIHLSSYGTFGYLLMCAPSMRSGIAHGVRLHALINPILPVRWEDLGGQCAAVAPPRSAMQLPGLDEGLYRFLFEAQFALTKTHVTDAMGPACLPVQLRLAWPAPRNDDGLARALGCPVVYGQGRSELRYDNAWLDRAPLLANPLTEAQLLQQCLKQLPAFAAPAPLAIQVHEALMWQGAPYPAAEAFAPTLCMSPRTLRRRLLAEGTAYAKILAQVRRARAEEMLCTTPMSIQAIAAALGFADARAFCHAYKRWSGHAPSQMRRSS